MAAEEAIVEPAAKKARTDEDPVGGARPATPDELVEGTPVVYWDTMPGFINDAFAPLDEFWVRDLETGLLVKDDAGVAVVFKSADLLLTCEAVNPGGPDGDVDDTEGKVGVLLLARQEQVIAILKHFGEPDLVTRRVPQQIIGLPCDMCDPEQLPVTAVQGVDTDVVAFGKKLRSDISVGVRAVRLKQAVEKSGPEFLLLSGYYCLVGVTLPYSLDECDLPELSAAEKSNRKKIFNQVDLGVTAMSPQMPGQSAENAMMQALGVSCGITLSDEIWRTDIQRALRKHLSIPELSTVFHDESGAQVNVIVLPEDATASLENGLLTFREPEGADYLNAAPATKAVPVVTPLEEPAAAQAQAMAQQVGKEEEAKDNGQNKSGEKTIGGKTVREWKAEQTTLFPNEKPLAKPWIRIRSRSSGQIYFFNADTAESTFDMPLPEGWTQQTSKSTGKIYYFHTATGRSMFERPV